MSKWTLLVTAGLALILSGCAHRTVGGSSMVDSNALSASGGDNSTQSYGVAADSTGYKVDDMGRHINSLSAPANQTYYFEFDSNKILASDEQAMNIQANYLAVHPNTRIRLEGNTDNRGSREYNIGLGWRRAQAVEQFLVQRGVKPAQIQMISYGKENPAAAGTGEKAWMLNRRVNLIYKVSK